MILPADLVRLTRQATGRPEVRHLERQRAGTREVVALAPRDAEGAEHGELLRGLDALGQQDRADRVGEAHQRDRQRMSRRVGVDAVRELEVELEDVGAELEDVLEA